MSFDTEGILKKVRALLDKADSTEFPAEADALRAKAEQFMTDYRIAQEDIIAADPFSIMPLLEDLVVCEEGTKFTAHYAEVFWAIAHHCGVRANIEWVYEGGSWRVVAHTVGYESDLRYAEYLYTAARLVFGQRIDPKADAKLTDAENVYRLRSAGIERRRIAAMLWGLDTHSSHAKVARLYIEECLRRGEEPVVTGRNLNAKTFREVYAREFAVKLRRRLYAARDAADSTGGALVLKSRKERVDEAFYTQFPSFRPAPASADVEPAEAPKLDRRRCAWTKADEARYQRQNSSAAALAGKRAGVDAAEAVELQRASTARRVNGHPSDAEGAQIVRELRG